MPNVLTYAVAVCLTHGLFMYDLPQKTVSLTPLTFILCDCIVRLAQFVSILIGIEERSKEFLFLSIVLKHPVVHADVFAFNSNGGLWCFGVNNEVVITMRAVFVALVELLGVLAEALLALLAGKDHFVSLLKRVAFGLMMTLGAVEPFTA